MESTICWKKIWQTITSSGLKEYIVSIDLINILKEKLLDGIALYKPHDLDSFNKWKEEKGSDVYKNLEIFILDLSVKLNLDAYMTWGVFCNYLMFEYYGKVDDIFYIVKYEIYTSSLINGVFRFYTSERMYIIKTIRYILEHYKDKNNEYYIEFQDFINSLTLPKIYKKLIEQFKLLIDEISPDNAKKSINKSEWVCRNNREQLETLTCIVLLMEKGDFNMDEFVELFKACRKRDFVQQPLYYEGRRFVKKEDYTNVQHVQLSIFFAMLDSCWNDETRIQPHANQIEEIILSLLDDGTRVLKQVLLLSWSTLQLTFITDDTTKVDYYYRFIVAALERNTFKTVYEIASNPLFANSKAGYITQKTIYNFMDNMCILFKDEGFIQSQEYSNKILVHFMKYINFATRCLESTDDRMKCLYNVAIEMFPSDFKSLTSLSKVLLNHKKYSADVLNSLLSLQIYTEECKQNVTKSLKITLTKPYLPDDKSNKFCLPIGTVAKIIFKNKKPYISFYHEYTYFQIMEQQIELLLKSNEYDDNSNIVTKIVDGYLLIIEIIKNISPTNQNRKSFSRCISLIDNIFMMLEENKINSAILLKVCVKLIITMVMFNYIDDIKRSYYCIKIFPKLTAEKINPVLTYTHNYMTKTVLLTLLKDEENTSNYEIILTYIDLIHNSFKKKVHFVDLQRMGFVYIILHVFPLHFSWSFKTKHDRNLFTKKCLSFILDILQQNRNNLTDDTEKELFDICLQAFLNNNRVLNAFISLLHKTNNYIQYEMETENNWENGRTKVLLDIIKYSFNLLLYLLKYNEKGKESGKDTLLAQKLLNTPNEHCTVVKSFTSFINNIFVPTLPTLSCTLLKNFALQSELPLLASLNLDYYQIQCVFLEKLRDPLIDSSFKISILEFVNACIKNQCGMTAAFFNIDFKMNNKKKSDDAESLGQILLNYLENIKEDLDYLEHPVQCEILQVFNTIWICKKQLLINDLITSEDFWENFSKPLFYDLIFDVQVYSVILHILSLELFNTRKKVDQRLIKIIKKLFDGENDYYKNWANYVYKISNELENISDKLDNFDNSPPKKEVYFLTTWNEFVIMSVSTNPEFFEDQQLRITFCEKLLDGLFNHFAYPKDIRVIQLLSQLYLFLIKTWNMSSTVDTVVKVANIMKLCINSYQIYKTKSRTLILAIVSETIKHTHTLKHFDCEGFLSPLGRIYDHEYNNLNLNMKNKMNSDDVRRWLLLLTIGGGLSYFGKTIEYKLWFNSIGFLKKLLQCVGPFLTEKNDLHNAKIAIQTLIIYARSPLCKEFINVNPMHLYYNFKPDCETITNDSLTRMCKIPQCYKDWWITFGEFMKFNITLIEKLGAGVLKWCFTFLEMQYEMLSEAIKLIKYTVDPDALNLVSLCLQFFDLLLPFRIEWIVEHTASFDLIMKSIKEAANACITIIIRPSILKFFKSGEMILNDKVPATIHVEIMNKVLEVISLSFKCFVTCMPTVTDYIGDGKLETKYLIPVDNSLQVPKVAHIEETPDIITYGGLICIVHVLCKTSEQISSANKQDIPAAENLVHEEKTLKLYNVFVRPQEIKFFPHERFTSVKRFTISDSSGVSDNWMSKLNIKKVRLALELILNFFSSHVYFVFEINRDTSDKFKQHLQRELSSELKFFHEFTKRTVYGKNLETSRKSKRPKREFLNFINCVDKKSDDLDDQDFHNEFLLFISYWLLEVCKIQP